MAVYESNQTCECFRGPGGGLTLVRGSLGLSYSFIMQQYLRTLLQHGFMVVLVTAEQSFERYQYALKKTGLNLQPYQQSGHLHVVEPPLAAMGNVTTPPEQQQHPGPGPRADAAGAPPPPITRPSAEDAASSGGGGGASFAGGWSSLQQLYAAVRRAMEQSPPLAAGMVLILDSLTVLVSLRGSEQEWAAFLHYCCGAAPLAGQRGSAQVPYCVVAGAYSDVPEDAPWLASLEHRANLVVSAEPLPGRIADVDGMVTITRRFASEEAQVPTAGGGLQAPLWDAASPYPWRKSLYFKSSELAVKWMDRVTARELL